MSSEITPGDKVRIKANPGRVGRVGKETDGPPHRLRVLVSFHDGEEEFILIKSLEKVEARALGPFDMVKSGRYGRVKDLRGTITFHRLSGKLANLIYSLNTTNTEFLAYQFKPVLQFLDSPSNGILIADEVGLGKTIEAGLIWTELRARIDAKRLLVICPAMLCEKWQAELSNRFGVNADIIDAANLTTQLKLIKSRPFHAFALIASIQGLRPPRNWNEKDSATAKLARLLDSAEGDEHLLDLLIVDEAHYLRNKSTASNELVRLLRPVSQSLILLSATPIQLRNTDLFNLLNLLDEDAFQYENAFERSLRANAPIIELRDRVLAEKVSHDEFLHALSFARSRRVFDDNAQLDFLIENPPTEDTLNSPRGRSEIADQLDNINPLTKAVTRTLKRDVQELRVQREPVTIRIDMHPEERRFYDLITKAVQDYCSFMDVSTGFLLTIPQRQMSSCMASAAMGWRNKSAETPEEIDTEAYEIYGDVAENSQQNNNGPLISALVDIACSDEYFRQLYTVDSKYIKLRNELKRYWSANPGQKVVLFSFYKKTLHYLQRRLEKDGIDSIVLHGGMDKQSLLEEFRDEREPHILLSSEVASEGVDLQFSSLLINYDLPWNPAKIEQRIGRIDRIGQKADKILIWNFIYSNTIDERIYDRLLERLDIFRRALGSMEALLGEEILKLSFELLSHRLSPEQEKARIDRARVAIETINRQQIQLEEQAANLIAHGDFIQNKVRVARDLGRYIRNEDLLAYVKDFLEGEYPGTRLIQADENENDYTLELSVQARLALGAFIDNRHLQGTTRILVQNPACIIFDNVHVQKNHKYECVSQAHPLVRFVSEQRKRTEINSAYSPVSAVQLQDDHLQGVSKGVYVYVVMRWSVTGARTIERLEYMLKNIEDNLVIESEEAEYIVNTCALEGDDWLGATSVLEHAKVADVLDECNIRLEERFNAFYQAQQRENRDRVNLMVSTLEQHLKRQSDKIKERVSNYQSHGNDKQKKMIPAEKGKLEKLRMRLTGKIDELRLKQAVQSDHKVVSSGVIRII
ncbi:MAG: DEAD/DEAH box helicase [Methylophaga sp.]|nr:DEAD/DEAH box helicase [Methylophaga sp.]